MNAIDKKQAGRAEIEEKNTTDYDSAWKDVIEELFEPFMEFFFPRLTGILISRKGLKY